MGGGRTDRQERSVTDQELDYRLVNWARCYRDRPKVHVSMLAKMIALYGTPEDFCQEDEKKNPTPVDASDAALVERSLCSPLYPEKYRLMICVLYLRPMIPVGRLGKAMGLNRRRFDEELHNACVMLSNILDFYARDKNFAFHNDEA
nr:MAG TPA_asm: hypothetical protein [Caudoviricetes sp.]